MFSSASPSAAGRSAVGALVLWEFLFLLPVLLLLPAVLRLPFAPERLESPCSSAPERGPFPVPLEVLADVWDLGDV